MKKNFLILVFILLSVSGYAQLSSLPSNLGSVTAFKQNSLAIPIIMPTGYEIPTPVVAEVWQVTGTVGSKISSITPTINIVGQTITVNFTSQQISKLASLSGSINYFLKFNGNYLLGGQLKVILGIGIPSVTPLTIQLPSIGEIKINLIGSASAALQYAQLADSLAEVAQTASSNSQTQASLAISAASTATTQALATKNKVAFGNASKLRAYPDTSFRVFTITDKGIEGIYNYNPDSSLPDDTSRTIISGTRRYERVVDGIVNVKWYGAKGDGITDDTQAIQKAINKNLGGTLFFPEGIYLADNIQNNSVDIVGSGSNKTFLKTKTNGATFFKLGWDIPHSRFKKISNLTVDGTNKQRNGFTLTYSYSPEVSGRWLIEEVVFINCDKAFYKPRGNIGNTLRNCLFYTSNYGYFAVGDSILMHAGFDDLNTCSFIANDKAGMYISSNTVGTGRTVLNSCDFQANQGFAIFIDRYKGGYSPLRFSNLWLELNGLASTVNIEGVNYSPIEVYLKNTDNVLFDGGGLLEIESYNSQVHITNASMYGPHFISKDSLSNLTIDYITADSYYGDAIVNNITKVNRSLSAQSSLFVAPKPKIILNRGVGIVAQSYSSINSYSMSGNVTINSTPTYDNYIFPYAADFTLPISGSVISPLANIVSGKYYVISGAFKHISGKIPTSFTFGYGIALNANLKSLLQVNKWVNIYTIGKADASISDAVGLYILNNASDATDFRFRIQGLQVVQFDTEVDAYKYYNEHTLSTDLPVIIYGSTYPTTGSWVKGDRVINNTPTIGQPKSWINTVSGSPGTFISEGDL